ncbi:MAG: DUF2312 domain-containing protein [Candidatus Symbiobacter sp.]|nr:DUF2312 domain-containing protein [Candidatus Symbiobacter sp.]
MADVGGISGDQLRLLIERIENLEEEKAQLAEQIRDVYAEAKAHGFDAKIIRQIVKLRKLDGPERDELETMLELYKAALGMKPAA